MSVFSDCSGQVLVWVGELRSPRFPFVCAAFSLMPLTCRHRKVRALTLILFKLGNWVFFLREWDRVFKTIISLLELWRCMNARKSIFDIALVDVT